MNVVTGLLAAKAARGTISKLFGTGWGRDDVATGRACSPPTAMLTQQERDETLLWRARAAAELESIREDGLLGPHWRRHPRTLFLIGYLNGTHHRIYVDNAARN